MMDAQHPVAQAVKRADPHAAWIHRQHRGESREHFARRLVGEGHREQAGGRDKAVLDQPGDARGEHARLSAAGAGKDQRMRAVRNRDGGELLGIEVF